MDKLLSIIIPSYNMEAYLERCLSSLVVGDEDLLGRLDVIIVNDGSKDRTSEIAHDFSERHNQKLGCEVFRVVDKQNGNYGSCVNVGLREACGRFVRVLDADDYLGTAAFERYLRFLIGLGEDSVPDLVLTDHDKVSAGGDVITSYHYPFPPKVEFGMDEILPHLTSIGMLAMTYRLDLLKSIYYVQTEGISYTDNEFVVIPMLFVRRIIYCPECVYHYFIGREGQSISVLATTRSVGMYMRLFENLGERLDSLRSRAAEANVFFADGYIEHLVGFVYSSVIYGLPGNDFNSCFGKWDALVGTRFPKTYRKVGAKAIMWRCVPYIRMLRRLQNVRLAQKFFLRTLRSVIALRRGFSWAKRA